MVTLLMPVQHSTNRFSSRAGNYGLYRPGYPAGIIPYLQQTIGLNTATRIADLGSGTGIFASLLLDAGSAVKAVEPNREMRLVAEKNLQRYSQFQSIPGTAEQTGLPQNSVDLVTVAQAFHWFDEAAVKQECKRILQPAGHVLLVWNILQSTSPFLKEYLALKEKYAEPLVHPIRANPDNIRRFFSPNPVITYQLPQTQWLDIAGLKGHLLSFSTVPQPAESNYKDMLKDLETLTTRYAENAVLKMEYETRLFLARLDK